MPPIFMAFVTERPQFFALHASVWGEWCSLKHGQKLENFVFLRQNRAIWWILLGAKFNKGDENKISVLQAQPTQLLWKNFIGGRGWYTGHHILVKYGRGYILQPSSVWFCTWFSKQMPSVPEAVQGAMPGPLKGPGKFWIDPFWGCWFWQQIVHFNFHYTFNLTKLFWPPSIYCWKLFGPPFRQLKTFLAPLHFAQPPSTLPSPPPPPRYLWTLP